MSNWQIIDLLLQPCGDEIQVKYTVSYEEAKFKEALIPKLVTSLESLRNEFHFKLTKHVFQLKAAKLGIQNYLDKFLKKATCFSAPAEVPPHLHHFFSSFFSFFFFLLFFFLCF